MSNYDSSLKHLPSALLEAQKNIGAATKDSVNPFFKSKYADLGSVMSVIKEPLNNAGLAVTQDLQISRSDGLKNILVTTLWHGESGETLQSEVILPDNSDIQKWGAGLTYMKRYQLQSLFFVPTEDNDGEDVVTRPRVKKVKSKNKKELTMDDVPF